MNKKISKLLIFTIIAMYMVVPAAFAEDVAADIGAEDVAELSVIAEDSDAEDASDAGVTPDSPLYGVDVAMDNIGLMLTFNKAKKAEKKLQIANERLKEAKMMAIGNNLVAMEKARVRHDQMLLSAEDDIEAIDTGDETEALKTNMKIKTMLQVHKQEVSDVEQELTLRIRGRLTAEQKEMLDSSLESMKGSSNSVEVKVQNREEKIKAVMKRTRNMSDAEIEDEFENVNREVAGEHLEQESSDFIGQAEKAIAHAEDLIAKKEGAGKDVTYAKEQLEEAKKVLSEAEAANATGDIELSVELAFKAKRIAIYAASGFSVEKLMNTPVKDNQEFNDMKENIRQMKEQRIYEVEMKREMEQERLRYMEQENMQDMAEELVGNVEDDLDNLENETDDVEDNLEDVLDNLGNETVSGNDDNVTVSGNSTVNNGLSASGNSSNVESEEV